MKKYKVDDLKGYYYNNIQKNYVCHIKSELEHRKLSLFFDCIASFHPRYDYYLLPANGVGKVPYYNTIEFEEIDLFPEKWIIPINEETQTIVGKFFNEKCYREKINYSHLSLIEPVGKYFNFLYYSSHHRDTNTNISILKNSSGKGGFLKNNYDSIEGFKEITLDMFNLFVLEESKYKYNIITDINKYVTVNDIINLLNNE